MIKFNFEVDSNERERILSLHESATKKNYLVIEQSVSNKTISKKPAPLVLGFREEPFDRAGFKLSDNGKAELDEIISQLNAYIKTNSSSYDVVITVTASESKVFQPKGAGYFARLRAGEVENYIKPRLSGNARLERIVLPMQGPAWSNKDKISDDDPMYKEHQWVKLSATAVTDICKVTRSDAQGTKGLFPDFISYEEDFDISKSGNKKVLFQMNFFEVPDFVRISIDGVVVQQGWFGRDLPFMRLLVGTFIYNHQNIPGMSKYKYVLSQAKVQAADEQIKRVSNSIDALRNMFPSANFDSKAGFFSANPEIKPYMIPDNILMKTGSLLPVDITTGSKQLKIEIISPLEDTVWNFKSVCKEQSQNK